MFNSGNNSMMFIYQYINLHVQFVLVSSEKNISELSFNIGSVICIGHYLLSLIGTTLVIIVLFIGVPFIHVHMYM